MFSRFKEALTNSLAPLDPLNEPFSLSSANSHSVRRSASFTSSTSRTTTTSSQHVDTNLKFPYSRPAFLNLTSEDEIQVTADHSIRPIIVPRGHGALPWNAGYAECINAGKSVRNEDQSALFSSTLKVVLNRDLAAKVDQLTTPSLLFKAPTSLSERKGGGTRKSQSLHNFNNSNHDNVNNEQEDVKEEEVLVEEEESKEQDVALIPWTYFGMFDGHAGPGVAVAAAAQLHSVIGSKLERIAPLLLHFWEKEQQEDEEVQVNGVKNIQIEEMMKELKQEPITLDSLIKGCLESSFWDFDGQVERDKRTFCLNGGCTALAALFILGKVYVANAGDSRAVLVSKKKEEEEVSWTARAVSFDFTPESERERVKMIALNKPELLGSTFTRLEFVRRPTRSDLGNQLLVRDAGMTGWTLKTITHSDLKFPLIFGSGKRSRVLGTIGVTRGFGDHELRAQFSDVYIKPFLSPQPQVQVVDCINLIEEEEVVLVMGTDGLWDVSSNERVADVVGAALDRTTSSEEKGKRKELNEDRYRFISAAQDLVMNSRGKLRQQQQLNSLVAVNGTSSRRSGWRTFEEKSATIDDISVFVIPLAPFARESREWRENMKRKKKK